MEDRHTQRHASLHYAPARDRAMTWEIDPNHSMILVTVEDLEQQVISIRFSRINGALVYDETRPSLSAVWVEINTDTIETGNQQRDEHLRSGDFLSAEDYPTIYFASRSVRPIGLRQFLVTGDLRVRDVIVPATLRVSFEGIVELASGREVAAFRGNACLSRHDFDLVWDREPRDTSESTTDELTVALHIRAIRAG